MKIKKVPQRMCIVSHLRHDKKDLIRIVKNKEGIITIDLSGKANGKGVYLTKDSNIIKEALANKILERALEAEIPKDVKLSLETMVK